ncbi:hypothetical protein RRG08_048628 [Elysia crispata]|uniref:Uncharacterized protein n=1 Tax=Elysia crispata TaxID=231223 RepID=A0AAE1ACS9_9GAST|nr:hypothetical protein RRG08_048628 [Elysia crispata]
MAACRDSRCTNKKQDVNETMTDICGRTGNKGELAKPESGEFRKQHRDRCYENSIAVLFRRFCWEIMF